MGGRYNNFPLTFLLGLGLLLVGAVLTIGTLVLSVLGKLSFNFVFYSAGIMVMGLLIMVVDYIKADRELQIAVERVDARRSLGLRQIKERVRGDEL